MLKSVILTWWVLMVIVAQVVGQLNVQVSSDTDWSMLGWAFGSSTCFMVYDAIEGKTRRKAWHLLGIIGLGMFLAMGFNQTLATKWSIDLRGATVALGLLGFVVLGKTFKKIDKAKSVSDLTD